MLDLNNNKFTYREEQRAKRGSMHNTYEKEFNKEHELKITRANLKAVDDLIYISKNGYYKLQYNKKSGLFDVVERKNPWVFILGCGIVGLTFNAIIITAAFFPEAFRTFFGF